jgi:hypothetical protein
VTPAPLLLLDTLRTRFAQHPARHPGVTWAQVLARLEANPGALAVLQAMDDTGGEPDVIAHDPTSGAVTFADCAAESPSGRRSLCYDNEALHARKEAKPAGSAVGMAAAMGVTLLTEAQYAQLQTLGAFDRKTSSWLHTPPEIRALGGAIFGDRRYDRVFTYHNGVQSYYAARGFRASLTV